MKRKTKTGVKMITSLVERMGKQELGAGDGSGSGSLLTSDFIYDLVFLYRAYGFFMLEEYDSALKDYLKSNQIKKLNASAQYNLTLAQGMKCFAAREFENAISFFTKAQAKLTSNRDPYLLRSICTVRYTISRAVKPQTKIKMLKDAKRDLNKAIKVS